MEGIKVSISPMQGKILQNEGYTASEVEYINDAKDAKGAPQPLIDIDSPAWIAARQAHKEFIAELRRLSPGASNKKIEAILNTAISQSGTSPFDFLKREYSRANKDNKPINYIEAQRTRAASRINNLSTTAQHIMWNEKRRKERLQNKEVK